MLEREEKKETVHRFLRFVSVHALMTLPEGENAAQKLKDII